MNESENKQLATNASIDRERMRYVNALFNGTSNTKRKRLYQEFGYPQDLCFDDFYRAYRRNAIAGAAVTRMVDGCWEDYPEVYEGDQTKDATQQTAWDSGSPAAGELCEPGKSAGAFAGATEQRRGIRGETENGSAVRLLCASGAPG